MPRLSERRFLGAASSFFHESLFTVHIKCLFSVVEGIAIGLIGAIGCLIEDDGFHVAVGQEDLGLLWRGLPAPAR